MADLLGDVALPDEVRELLRLRSEPGQLGLITYAIDGSHEAYAVKTDDFPLFKECALTIAAAYAATSLSAWAPIAIANLVVLLYQFRQKRIRLSAEQAMLLQELIRTPGLTVSELTEWLKLPEPEVVSALQELKAIESADGTTSMLVDADSEGRWRAVGV